ncbi:AAA family ATPase, partial [Clostridium luticellarii]|uniref:AAA family ATPase n=1 Tax=Clostridium luticellarii TaxID=1691940 RepID=UPI0023563DA8
MEENFIKEITIRSLKNCGYISEIEGLKKFNSITLNKPVTFFSGENGTGKSTFLEAIAINWGFNPEGGSKNFSFSTKNTHSNLYKYITLSKSVRRATDGFFLRAESFYNVATYAEDIELDFSEYGDRPIHQQSHGESF